MPTIGAAVLASAAGWILSDALDTYLGTVPTVLISLVVTTVLYFAARKWLRNLRDGG